MTMFNIKSYPSILAFATVDDSEQVKMIEYSGDFKDYRSLYYFIDQIAIPGLLNKKTTFSEDDEEEIDIIKDSYGFSNKCLKKPGYCVIGLFEGKVKFI